MECLVKRVRTKRAMRDFLRLPGCIYKDDPYWITPMFSEIRSALDTRRNPFYREAIRELFVCYRKDAAVGRVAVVLNRRHWRRFMQKSVFFGFFECMQNPEAARALFNAAESWAREQGADLIEGPFNPHHYSELGMQINACVSSPSFFQSYNPVYYNELLKLAGFRETKRLQTRKNDDIGRYIRARFSRSRPLYVPGYTVRTLLSANLPEELERIREVFNDAFSNNWHFLPLTRQEYTYSARFMNLVTLPELIIIIEHRDEPVAVLEFVQDVNPLLKQFHGTVGPLKLLRYHFERKRIDSLVIYAVGIKKAYQGSRVFALLLDAACRIVMNYRVLQTTWISPENILAHRASEYLGLRPDKEFAIYEKSLRGPDMTTNNEVTAS